MSHKLVLLPYLIKYIPQNALNSATGIGKSANVYAYDLDHTIIQPKTRGSRFSRSSDDWEFMSFTAGKNTLQGLISIVSSDPLAQVVIFSNQGAVITVPASSKSCFKYTGKIKLLLEAISQEKDGEVLLERLWIYSAPKKPAAWDKKHRLISSKSTTMKITKYSNNTISASAKIDESMVIDPEIFTKMRKPDTGMMIEFKKDFEKAYPSIENLKVCYFCGDAAGRRGDFSDSDKEFARRLEIPFKLPDDLF